MCGPRTSPPVAPPGIGPAHSHYEGTLSGRTRSRSDSRREERYTAETRRERERASRFRWTRARSLSLILSAIASIPNRTNRSRKQSQKHWSGLDRHFRKGVQRKAPCETRSWPDPPPGRAEPELH